MAETSNGPKNQTLKISRPEKKIKQHESPKPKKSNTPNIQHLKSQKSSTRASKCVYSPNSNTSKNSQIKNLLPEQIHLNPKISIQNFNISLVEQSRTPTSLKPDA